MSEVKPADQDVSQEVGNETNVLLELRNKIQQLVATTLSDSSIVVLQDELRILQRSSYYLEFHGDDSQPAADQQDQQDQNQSGGGVWGLLDQHRLQDAVTGAGARVRLLLTLLRRLYGEIVSGCQALEDFLIKCDGGLMDAVSAPSVEKLLQQTQQDLEDFQSPCAPLLNLQTCLIPNQQSEFPSRLRSSLSAKMPVIINRFRTHAGFNAVQLFWTVPGQEDLSKERFEVQVSGLHLDTAEDGRVYKAACRSHSVQVNNLTPDRFYRFSVRRAPAANLVYAVWVDEIILKTPDSPTEDF